MTQAARSDGSTSQIGGEAFAFVQMLADELSAGQIELPSFPDAAIKVRQALSDDEVSLDKVQRIVSSEAALAARIMQMANSAALNRSGKAVVDLKSAIARIGFNLVRSASLVFAMGQMRKAEQLAPVRERLLAHWQRSNQVAAFCHVVARRLTRINPDTALLAGLLHGIGRLYVISRSIRHPKLFSDPATFNAIEREWSDTIATALLGNWGLEGEVLDAICHYEDLEREHAGPADLTDVLTIGNLLASLHAFPDEFEIGLQNVTAAARLKLDRAACDQLIAESRDDIAILQSALAG